MRARSTLALIGAALAAASGPAAARAPQESRPHDFASIRVVEHEGGCRIELQTAILTFEPEDGAGPLVTLIGTTHFADKGYYDVINGTAEEHDVVLFELVTPKLTEHDAQHLDPESLHAVLASRARLRLEQTGIRILRYRHLHGRLPESLEALGLGDAVLDPWGNPIQFMLTDDDHGFNLRSLGADGRPGGRGPDADIWYPAAPDDQRPASSPHDLLTAVGLVPQEIPEGDRWRHSDMNEGELARRLQDANVPVGLLEQFDSIQLGPDAAAFLADNPSHAAIFKATVVESTVAFASREHDGGSELGGLLGVIVGDRNQVVVDDIRRIIEEEPHVRTIAVVYGAAHLPDMSQRLTRTLGYTLRDTRMVPCIRIDFAVSGVPCDLAWHYRALAGAAVGLDGLASSPAAD